MRERKEEKDTEMMDLTMGPSP
jgi:uncharacterized protein (DUF885 family)